MDFPFYEEIEYPEISFQSINSLSHEESIKKTLLCVFQEIHCVSNVKEVVVDMFNSQFLQNLEFFLCPTLHSENYKQIEG